jgi:site-specific DNA-cytosine methylase
MLRVGSLFSGYGGLDLAKVAASQAYRENEETIKGKSK